MEHFFTEPYWMSEMAMWTGGKNLLNTFFLDTARKALTVDDILMLQ